MKRATIFVGSWVDDFVDKLGFFKYMERELGYRTKRVGEFVYETNTPSAILTFRFCMGPSDDLIYRIRKSLRKDLPPSVGHIIDEGVEADEIYYLGFCGMLKGKGMQVYLPNKFRMVAFKDYFLSNLHAKKIKVKKEIACDNILIGAVKGTKCSLITSNQVLSLRYMADNEPKTLRAISLELKKHADIVEMENYAIVKNFGSTHPIGIFLFGMDSPLQKQRMLGRKNQKSLEDISREFNRRAIEVIRFIIENNKH